MNNPCKPVVKQSLKPGTSKLEDLAQELYILGLSTRDIEEALVDTKGKTPMELLAGKKQEKDRLEMLMDKINSPVILNIAALESINIKFYIAHFIIIGDYWL